MNLNPKVIYGAAAAALVGGLTGLALALPNIHDTGRALLIGLLSAFLTGFASGLAGYLKDQGDWNVGAPAQVSPPAPVVTPPPGPPAA